MVLDRLRFIKLELLTLDRDNQQLALRETIRNTPSSDTATKRHNRRENIVLGALAAVVLGGVAALGNAYCEGQTGQSLFSLVKGEIAQRVDTLKAQIPQAIYQAIPGPAYKR